MDNSYGILGKDKYGKVSTIYEKESTIDITIDGSMIKDVYVFI